MTITNHPQAIHSKKRMPRDVWIFMQGYHTSSIPPRVTWYSVDRDFIERTESMNLNFHAILPASMGASIEELEEMLAEVRSQKRLLGG